MADRTRQADLLRGRHNRASGVKIPELEHMINGYLTEMSSFLQDNPLLISAPKSEILIFGWVLACTPEPMQACTPEPMQANTHPKIKISDAELPFVRNPQLLGVYLDTLFSFNAHCLQVANRVSKKEQCL